MIHNYDKNNYFTNKIEERAARALATRGGKRDGTKQQKFVGWLNDEFKQFEHLKKQLDDCRREFTIKPMTCLCDAVEKAKKDVMDAEKDVLGSLPYATVEQLYDLKDATAYQNDEKMIRIDEVFA